MKMLVCTDGSENSQKCIEFAAKMTGECTINEVVLIYVHDSAEFFPDYWQGKYPFTPEEKQSLQKIDSKMTEDRKKIFAGALDLFADSKAKVETLFKIGHPAETIVKEADSGAYDLVVIGRRGNSGVKKLFMGSVSSTVLQAVKTNVLIVK